MKLDVYPVSLEGWCFFSYQRWERIPRDVRIAVKCKLGLACGDWGLAYQLQNATMNPHQENRNTRPYTSTGLSIGMLRAFPFSTLTSGLDQSEAIRKPMLALALTCLSDIE